MAVELQQMPGGHWVVLINKGRPMPATDVETELWIRLQEALGK
jgi:hypothetical protein